MLLESKEITLSTGEKFTIRPIGFRDRQKIKQDAVNIVDGSVVFSLEKFADIAILERI
jgi:hypothetical protein